MSNASIPTPKVQMYGLVRDRNGKPRIDGDPRKLHHSVIESMTREEFELACKEYDTCDLKN